MGSRPGLRSVVIDCREPLRLARFWAAVLGWRVCPFDEEEVAELAARGLAPETAPSACVDPPDPELPNVWFQQVPEPKVAKNRVHLDVNVPDVAGIERLVSLGAQVLLAHPGGERWTIMADPEGNEFCVFPLDAEDVED